jgi:hypothetical protein
MTLHMQDACTFDLLVYTDNNVDVPQTWEESDPKYINNQQVRLSMGFGCLFVERALNMTLCGVCVCATSMTWIALLVHGCMRKYRLGKDVGVDLQAARGGLNDVLLHKVKFRG